MFFSYTVCICVIAGVTEGHALTTRVCAAIGFLHPEAADEKPSLGHT